MNEPTFENFDQDFRKYKDETGIKSDPDETVRGLWDSEQAKRVRTFEQKYPGVNEEFDQLILLLPDPDNIDKDEFPFAASVVRISNTGEMEVLARSANRVKKNSDSTQHAELAAMQDAQQKIGNRHLDGATLLSTAQPCEMCAGAVRNTGISTVVYAVSQKDLEGTHVEFPEGFKVMRTVPPGIDIDGLLQQSGVNVFAGYKRSEVLKKLSRTVGTFDELYRDPDARL